jgi:hypothetical protein
MLLSLFPGLLQAYKLDLLDGVKIHPVFHVSQLKPKLGKNSTVITQLPSIDSEGVLRPEPKEILGRQTRKKNNRALIELMVCWHGQQAEDAS